MKRIFVLAVFSLLLLNGIYAQSTISVVGDTTKLNDTLPLLTQETLSDVQLPDFEATYEKWRSEVFRDLVSKNGFTQNCKICDAILLDVIFITDSAGKVTKAVIERSNIDCPGKTAAQEKAFEKKLFDSIKKIEWPASMSRVRFRHKFGMSTKC